RRRRRAHHDAGTARRDVERDGKAARGARGARPHGRGSVERGRDRARLRERSAVSAVATTRQESWARSTWDYYVTTIRTQLQAQFQYRAAVYAYMVALVAEPVICLVVWTTIARSQGGSVQGIGVGQFAAYYVVWTLVRGWNVVFTPFGWEWRVRGGEIFPALFAPQHPTPSAPRCAA